MNKKITWQEVEKNKEEGWVVWEKKVLNVKQFLQTHPGGPELLRKNFGKDITRQFSDKRHSQEAIKMAEQYCLGDLDLSSKPKEWQIGKGKNSQSTQWIIVSVIVLLALALGVWKIVLKK